MDRSTDSSMHHMLRGRAAASLLLSVVIAASILLHGCGSSEKPEENGNTDQSTAGAATDSAYVEEGDTPVGDPESANDVSFTDIDSVTFSLSEFRGSIVMIDFWRTDSERCMDRLGTVKELFGEFRDDGFHIVSVAMDRVDEDKLRLIRQRYKLPFPIVRGVGKLSLESWLLGSLPVSFIHDRDGRLGARIVGLQEKEVYEKQIRLLLDGSQSADTLKP